MSHQINITRIKAVARALHNLQKDVVFVGGATVSLYADAAAAESRPTDDVDVVIELASYAGYAALDEQLRNAGFVNDTVSGVICRYQTQGIIVDILPTIAEVIGFSNKWYPEGFKQAIPVLLGDMTVKIFSLPFFIASKLEAYKNRGGNDYRFSSDFEDIVYVLENNSEAEQLLLNSQEPLRSYLIEEFCTLLKDPALEEGLYAHLEPRNAPQQIEKIESILRNVSGYGSSE